MNRILNFLKRQFSFFFDFRKISSKLLIGIISVSILFPASISLFLINFAETRIESYVIERNENTVNMAKRSIELFIEQQKKIATTSSYNSSIIDQDIFNIRSFFIQIKREFPIIKSITLYDFDSLKVIYSSNNDVLVNSELSVLLEPNQINRLLNKKYFWSDVSLSENSQPQISIYHPVIRFGRTISFLEFTFDLKYIWNTVDNIKFGKYGEAMLLNNDSKVIAHKSKEFITENKTIETQIDKSVPFGSTPYKNENNEDIIGTYAHFDELDWYLIIEQKIDESQDLSIEMRQNMISYLAISLFLALFIGVLIARKISNPIEELIQGVKQYGQGQLQHQIILNSNDELEDLAEEFNRMSKNLYYQQKKLRRIERISAMTKFVRMISHEIRNPLNSMNINMKILNRELAKDVVNKDKAFKFLEIVSSEITRMDDLITNYSMIAQSPQMDIQYNDIHSIIDHVLLLHEAEAKEQKIKFVKKYYKNDIKAHFDANQIKQVLINLIINSIQAMPSGGTLTVGTNIVSDNVFQVTVNDTGTGISRDKLSEIFEFYYTSKKSGTGIGLSLSKQIIEGHNGILFVESELAKFTTFYIEMPIKQSKVLNS